MILFMLKNTSIIIYLNYFFKNKVLDKSIPNKKKPTKIKYYHTNLTLFLHMASNNPENYENAHTQVMGFTAMLQRTDM